MRRYANPRYGGSCSSRDRKNRKRCSSWRKRDLAARGELHTVFSAGGRFAGPRGNGATSRRHRSREEERLARGPYHYRKGFQSRALFVRAWFPLQQEQAVQTSGSKCRELRLV